MVLLTTAVCVLPVASLLLGRFSGSLYPCGRCPLAITVSEQTNYNFTKRFAELLRQAMEHEMFENLSTFVVPVNLAAVLCLPFQADDDAGQDVAESVSRSDGTAVIVDPDGENKRDRFIDQRR